MVEQRLRWVEESIRLAAYNSNEELVGYLEYENVGRHMHWCWYQSEGFRMSPGCLQEVRDMQKKALKRVRHD